MPPVLPLDDEYVLDGWRVADAAAHRAFAEDPVAARFLGWTVEEARAQPDDHYVAVVKRFREDWASGSRFSLAIRRRATGEAVGAVEIRPAAEIVQVSYPSPRPFADEVSHPAPSASCWDGRGASWEHATPSSSATSPTTRHRELPRGA